MPLKTDGPSNSGTRRRFVLCRSAITTGERLRASPSRHRDRLLRRPGLVAGRVEYALLTVRSAPLPMGTISVASTKWSSIRWPLRKAA
jgi:hypothetical protein